MTNEMNVFKGSDNYVVTEDLMNAVNVSIALKKPLLIKGEPGTGKTMLAESSADALGMGLIMPADTPDLIGKDIIIVASTLIMYADVNRQVKRDDGTYTVGIHARQFTPEVLQYLFRHIADE